MESARVIIEVTAGVVPGHPEEEYGRRWALTTKEWEDATGRGEEGQLLAELNGRAQGYAGWLMLQPANLNWVRTDWLWL
jgi:hypothetical protein